MVTDILLSYPLESILVLLIVYLVLLLWAYSVAINKITQMTSRTVWISDGNIQELLKSVFVTYASLIGLLMIAIILLILWIERSHT